jgi:hypothetical protein
MSDEEITAVLGASLPKGEHNGLTPYARLLADKPKKIRPVLALIDCVTITENTDDGSQKAKVRIRRIELITDEGDAKIIERCLLRAFETRTGAVTLPFDLESDVRSAFDDMQDDVEVDTSELETEKEAYDNGGALPDGVSTVYNNTDEAEQVSTADEQDPTAGPWE